MRDHEPVLIEEFNGLWARGDFDSCPLDHFPDCENIQFIEGGYKTRDGLDVLLPYRDVLRIYTYVQATGESLLVLDIHGDFYHSLSPTPYTPILSIPAATDFSFVSIAGRAYITPHDGHTGLAGEFVYVYKGDGSLARKAGGAKPTNGNKKSFLGYNNGQSGIIDAGVHIYGVSYVNGTGESIIGPEVFATVVAPGASQIVLNNIPISPDVTVTSREIIGTVAFDPAVYDPNQINHFYFLVATISDNTTTSLVLNYRDLDIGANKTPLLTVPSAPGAPSPPVSNALLVKNTDIIGFGGDLGFHIFAVVYETDTGFLTNLGPEVFAATTVVNGLKKINISNIPTSPDSFVVARWIVATKALEVYDGNQEGYQFFFVPNGRIPDNLTTTLDFLFFDAELLADASHLFDNFTNIPAGVGINTYHGRLAVWGEKDNISTARLSAVGEPEAISEVDGIIIVPLDGNPLTNGQEFRDVFYLFKQTRTFAFTDNGDEPSTWPMIIIDQGIGSSVHGVGTVLDSGGVNIDYLIIVDFSGIMLFNGAYVRPELSWKIKDFWFKLDKKVDFYNIQIMNNSLDQVLFITLPTKKMIIGDYSNGLDPKNIRWAPWRFDVETTTITLKDINVLIIGAKAQFVP